MTAGRDTALPAGLVADPLPGHVAIIMDGNGRWAEARGKPRIHGHQAGVRSVRTVAEAAAQLHLQQLTLYAFSVDNWKRPKPEVDFLMRLLTDFLLKERPTLKRNGVRLTSAGRIEGLPVAVRTALHATEEFSRDHDGMVLCLALNYGGRAELADAARALARRARDGTLDPEAIDEATVAGALYPGAARDVDLLIRTGGEQRVSDFLLWQISYAELHVTPTYWPEFGAAELHAALRDYAGRERRFGGLGGERSGSPSTGAQ